MVRGLGVGLPIGAAIGGGHQWAARVDTSKHRSSGWRNLNCQCERFGVVTIPVGGSDRDVVDACVTGQRVERDRSRAIAVVDQRRERRCIRDRGIAQRHDVTVRLRRGDRKLDRTAHRHGHVVEGAERGRNLRRGCSSRTDLDRVDLRVLHLMEERDRQIVVGDNGADERLDDAGIGPDEFVDVVVVENGHALDVDSELPETVHRRVELGEIQIDGVGQTRRHGELVDELFTTERIPPFGLEQRGRRGGRHRWIRQIDHINGAIRLVRTGDEER